MLNFTIIALILIKLISCISGHITLSRELLRCLSLINTTCSETSPDITLVMLSRNRLRCKCVSYECGRQRHMPILLRLHFNLTKACKFCKFFIMFLVFYHFKDRCGTAERLLILALLGHRFYHIFLPDFYILIPKLSRMLQIFDILNYMELLLLLGVICACMYNYFFR